MNFSMLGTNSTSNLNNDLITKLKSVDISNKITPLDNQLTNIKNESSFVDKLKSSLIDFKNSLKYMNSSSSQTIFNQKQATIDGTSIKVKNSDNSLLQNGVIKTKVSQLAQKDVIQSNIIINKDTLFNSSSITINNKEFVLDNKNINDLIKDINDSNIANASLEEVSKDNFRLVIKSKNTGLDNKINITQNNIDLGLSLLENNVLKSQNSKINVDGIDYEMSTNDLKTNNGLEFTAKSIGDTNITIEDDNTSLESSLNNFVSSYNSVMDLLDEQIYNSTNSNKTSLESLKKDIKNFILTPIDKNNIFSNGFSLDKDGNLSLDYGIFKTNYDNNKSSISSLLIGTNDNKGIGTKLNDYLDGNLKENGMINEYINLLNKRKDFITNERELNISKLDSKYNDLSMQFSEYNGIISSMESSFASLKLLIDNPNN